MAEESIRRGVSAAEKYAELAALGQERPVCLCHGEPQLWLKSPGRIAGGRWMRCAVNNRKKNAAYRSVSHEKRAAYQRAYLAANREKLNAYKSAWRAANPEKVAAHSAAYRAANRESILEKHRAAAAKKRSDPDFRRRKTLYMLDYQHRRKHERWADQGLTLRNDGEEGSARGDRTAA